MPALAAVLPGLAYFACVAAVLFLLRRHDDRLRLTMGLALAVLAALPFRAALFEGAVLLPLDTLRGQAPFRELPPTEPHGNPIQGDLIQLIQPSMVAVREAWRAGEWPLWNSRVGLGLTLLGDPQAQAFQPLGLAFLPLDPLAAPGALAALRTFLALLFGFLLLRRLGAGSGPALAGAVAYGGSGFLGLWIGWPLATSAAALPAVLYGIVRLDERGERRDRAFLAVALFVLLTGGHPQTVAYAGLVSAAFAILRIVRRKQGQRRPLLLRLVVPALVAGLLAAPGLLAFAESVPGSLRASREVAPPAGATVTRLIQVIAPNALGNSRYARYWGAVNSNEDAAAFAGTAALLGALVTAGAALARRPAVIDHERAALVLAATALALSAVEVGRLGFLAALGLAAAAAAACERLARTTKGGLFALGVGLLIVVGLHAGAYLFFANLADPADLDVLRRGFLHWHLRFAVVSVLVLALGRGRRWPAFVVALGLAAELYLVHGREQTLAPASLATAIPGPLAHLREHAGDARIAAFGPALPPNVASLHGLSDVRAYNPMAPVRTFELLAPVLAGWAGEAPLLRNMDDPVYDRLAVGFLLGAPEDACPAGTAETFRDPAGVVCRRPAPWSLARSVANPGARLDLQRTMQGDGLGVLSPPAGLVEIAVDAAPGWRVVGPGARLVPAPVLRLEVEARRDRIEILYRPLGLVAGLTLAAFGFVLAAARFVPVPGRGSRIAPWPRPRSSPSAVLTAAPIS